MNLSCKNNLDLVVKPMNDLPNPKVSELILIFSNTLQLLELILDEYLLLFLHLMYIIRNNTKKIIENEIAINIKNGILIT